MTVNTNLQLSQIVQTAITVLNIGSKILFIVCYYEETMNQFYGLHLYGMMRPYRNFYIIR